MLVFSAVCGFFFLGWGGAGTAVLIIYFLLGLSACNYLLFFGVLLDKLSFVLIFLTVWVFLMSWTLNSKYKSTSKKMGGVLMMMFMLIFLSFSMKSMIFFYFMFEASLIPLVLLIFGWGYQVERVQAAFYLFIYTVVGSVPLLFFLVFQWYGVVWVSFLYCVMENMKISSLLFMFLSFSFLIKLPAYAFHLWLPKAHVEAPVFGSMVLAAVLLKMSMYGFYRVLSLTKTGSFFVFLMCFLNLGAVVSAVIAFRQPDLKSLVAFSSISHMGVMLGGVFTMYMVSVKGVFLTSVIHGFCSASLFYLVNIFYEMKNTRQILMMSGYTYVVVGVAFWWFVFAMVNFAAPPFLSILSEILVVSQMMFISFKVSLMPFLVSFLVSAFSIFVFSCVSLGEAGFQKGGCVSMEIKHTVLLFLAVPCIFLVFADEILFFY